MTDNILMTPAITVAVGLVVFGATQIAQSLWLDPVTEMMKALGRDAYVHAYFANVYASPGAVPKELASEASKELRKCAAELRATLRAVRFYRAFQAMNRLPPKENVRQAARRFIAISNVSTEEDTKEVWKEADEIAKLLGFTSD